MNTLSTLDLEKVSNVFDALVAASQSGSVRAYRSALLDAKEIGMPENLVLSAWAQGVNNAKSPVFFNYAGVAVR